MVCRTEICLEATAEQSHCTATPAARTRCHLRGGGVDHFAPLQRGNRLQHSLGRLRDGGGKKREGRRAATIRPSVVPSPAVIHLLGSSVVAYRTSVVHRPPTVRATVSPSVVRAALIAKKNLLRTSDSAAAAARKNLPTHPSPAAAFAAAAAVTLAPI